MDTNSIKAFIAVAETMSVTKAAQRLFLTQPAISRRIAQLEDQLGVKLFDRVNKKMYLTVPANELFPRCKQIIADIDFAAQQASTLGNRVMGPLTIGMSHHISLYRAPQNLKRYQDLYPDVELHLEFINSEDAIQRVARGQLELAMVTLPPRPMPNLDFIAVWRDELYIAVPNTSEYRNISFAQLSKKPVILPHINSTTRKNIDQTFKNCNLTYAHITETSNFEVIAKMLETGLGWSVLPAHMMNKNIIRAFADVFIAVRIQGIVRHNQRQLSRASQALLDLMIDQLSRPKPNQPAP